MNRALRKSKSHADTGWAFARMGQLGFPVTATGSSRLCAVLLFTLAEAVAREHEGRTVLTEPTITPSQRVILISISDRKLMLVADGRIRAAYPVAVGAPLTPSPTGHFTIVNKVSTPTYYHHGRVVPPGRSNPLGNRWVGLSERGFGIHGTNVPGSIGRAASHGCIRLRQKDLEEFFKLVRVGDEVEIMAERDARWSSVLGAPCCSKSTPQRLSVSAVQRSSPSTRTLASTELMAGD